MSLEVPIDDTIDPEIRFLLEELQNNIAETFSLPGSRSNSQNIDDLVDASTNTAEVHDDSGDDEGTETPDVAALARLYPSSDEVRDDQGPRDDLSKASVQATMQTGCGCTNHCFKFNGVDVDRVWESRINMAEFPKEQFDVLILSKLEQSEVMGDPKGGGKRERQHFQYRFSGQIVCEKAWRYIHNIGKKRFGNLKSHYKLHGVVPRDHHGLKGKRPANAFSFEVSQDVVQFLVRYGEENGLPMPAAPRGRDGRAPVYLPSSDRFADVYNKYVDACNDCEPIKQHVGETTFRNIWLSCVPHIQKMEPCTDVCAKCEQFRNNLKYAVTEDDKLINSLSFSEHILKAQNERKFLNECIRKAQDELRDRDFSLPATACSQDLYSVHYTFDFAQSFVLPHQSRQVSQLYFLNPLRVNCFRICNDGLKLQMNYLFDESQTIGIDNKSCHGANNVVCMLDNYFNHPVTVMQIIVEVKIRIKL
ncbi:uncharacterized protein [Ptychodera flava]|uniref:uncharacterized protein n=1 Tax=Ptychodera flava TaxID=63121 RepID=UPI00396A768B